MRFLFKHRDRIFALLPGLLCKLHKKITKKSSICGFFRNLTDSIRIEGGKEPLQNGGHINVKCKESTQLQ